MATTTRNQADTQTGLATVAEATAFLSIGRTTLDGLRRSGAIQSVRIGRARRYEWQELRRYVDTLKARCTM